MNKTKVVGDKPKKRIAHVFTKYAGIHEGIYRDEPGWFNSSYKSYCFGYGYFFRGDEYIGKRLSPEYINENWNKLDWKGGLKQRCIAYIDRKRKIAVIYRNSEYYYSIKSSLPHGYKIYALTEHISMPDITSAINKRHLLKAYTRTLIKDYLDTFYYDYRITKTDCKCKICYNDNSWHVVNRENLRIEILDLYRNNKNYIPLNKPLDDFYYVRNIKVDFPSIKTISDNTLFDDNEKHLIEKAIFYTKYCYKKDVAWKEVDKHFDEDKWKDEIIEFEKSANIRFENKCKELEQRNRNKFIENYKYVDEWRRGITSNLNKVATVVKNSSNRTVKNVYYPYIRYMFPTTQLRIKSNKPNWIETSRNAIVYLYDAIRIFNQLYTDYIINGTLNITFNNKYYINKFQITSLSYCEKYDDIFKQSLGVYDYKIVIGCHTLWFEDIKNFARYYNLQNLLVFPLDKDIDTCIKEKLIYLNTNKTIQAVGTSDVLDK